MLEDALTDPVLEEACTIPVWGEASRRHCICMVSPGALVGGVLLMGGAGPTGIGIGTEGGACEEGC